MAATETKQERLVDQAYRRIIKLVANGQLREDDNITFSQLSARLGIGRMPVTVALDRLQREGLIQSVPRLGTRLRRIDACQIWEMVRWRVAIECEIASEACQWMTPQQRRQLIEAGQQTDQDMRDAYPKLARFLEALEHGKLAGPSVGASQVDLEWIKSIKPADLGSEMDNKFHLLLASMCQVPKLHEEIERTLDIYAVKMAVCETVTATAAYALPRECPANHAELARAIAEGTPEQAAASMRGHIENSMFLYGFVQWYRTHGGSDRQVDNGE